MFELLAPAGDFEKLKIAALYGADAVYVGGQNFSLRANAKNFSLDDLLNATKYMHDLNKKIYVTINIVFHEEDLNGLEEYLKYLAKIKVDGVIVSDIAVIKKINDLKLDLFIVLSTQASTLNNKAVKFWQNLGVKRIVLARESSKENIKKIIEETGIEVESFIHGSMCTSFSGKCILSNITTLRDANRGGCAQVCRWCFETENNVDFTMMPKDLNMVEHINEMMDIGVFSYKVEGRMRSIYYIATIINVYRNIFDLIISNNLTDALKKYYLNILNRCANRESKAQFFASNTDYTDQYFSDRMEVTNKDFLGVVQNTENDLLVVEQRNYFKKGDVVEFFGPNMEPITYTINKIHNEKNEIIDIANHPQMIVKLNCNIKLPKFTMMRLKVFDKSDYL